MTTPTIAEQLRRAQVSNLQAQYILTMTVTDRGDLPDAGAFVFEILDDDDPKEDLFARVATVADLETFGLSRSAALISGAGFYRSSTVTKSYVNTQTGQSGLRAANEAKGFLVERVNELVSEYQTFLNEFKADPPEVFVFPEADAGILTPLVDDYTAKKEERAAQEETVDAKQDECDELDAEYTAAVADADAAQQVLDALNKALSSLQTAKTALTNIDSASSDLSDDVVDALTVWNNERGGMSPASSVDAVDAELEQTTGALWTEYYDNFAPARTQLAQDIANIDSEIQQLTTVQIPEQQTRLNNANTARDAALTAKEECARELAEAQQVLEVLEREEQNLLNQVRALCPTFTS